MQQPPTKATLAGGLQLAQPRGLPLTAGFPVFASHVFDDCSCPAGEAPIARFQPALLTRSLSIVEAAALGRPSVRLDDALAILVLLAEAGEPHLSVPRRRVSAGC